MTNPIKTMKRILKTQQKELSTTKHLTKTYEPSSLPEIQQSIYKNNCVQLYLQES